MEFLSSAFKQPPCIKSTEDESWLGLPASLTITPITRTWSGQSLDLNTHETQRIRILCKSTLYMATELVITSVGLQTFQKSKVLFSYIKIVLCIIYFQHNDKTLLETFYPVYLRYKYHCFTFCISNFAWKCTFISIDYSNFLTFICVLESIWRVFPYDNTKPWKMYRSSVWMSGPNSLLQCV